MILMFGPAGAGKSLQGQFVALRHGWTWLSGGQLLRDAHDPQIDGLMKTGNLLPVELVNRIVFKALDGQSDLSRVILDGYPRSLDQARALSEYCAKRLGREGVSLIIALDVSDREILKRLSLRGRMDDNAETIKHRLEIYHEATQPLLDHYAEQKVSVVVVDGNGKPGEIFDRIEDVIQTHVMETTN